MLAMQGKKRFALAAVAILTVVALLAAWYLWSRSEQESLPQATGPQIKASVGPNANLPEIRAGSQGCAVLDKVLSNLLQHTPEGKAFTGRAAQIKAQQNNPGSGPENATPDGAMAQHQLEEGKTPEQNPEYVKKSEQLDKLLDQVSWCMPTWPVLFG